MTIYCPKCWMPRTLTDGQYRAALAGFLFVHCRGCGRRLVRSK